MGRDYSDFGGGGEGYSSYTSSTTDKSLTEIALIIFGPVIYMIWCFPVSAIFALLIIKALPFIEGNTGAILFGVYLCWCALMWGPGFWDYIHDRNRR